MKNWFWKTRFRRNYSPMSLRATTSHLYAWRIYHNMGISARDRYSISPKGSIVLYQGQSLSLLRIYIPKAINWKGCAFSFSPYSTKQFSVDNCWSGSCLGSMVTRSKPRISQVKSTGPLKKRRAKSNQWSTTMKEQMLSIALKKKMNECPLCKAKNRSWICERLINGILAAHSRRSPLSWT